MTPEEMVLDPFSFAADSRDEDSTGERPLPLTVSGDLAEPLAGTVPPVRTIVLDRPPTPARPQEHREAVRLAPATAGPERLSLRDVSVAYGDKEAVKSVSL